MDKSKIEKAVVGCIMLAFLCFFGYDFYKNKNTEDKNASSLVYSTNKTPEDISSEENTSKDTSQKSNKQNKVTYKEKISKKSKCKKKRNGKLININTATVSELCDGLNGIGKKKAMLIVSYRNKVGKFSNIEEIKNIKGIGEKTFSNLADSITV